MSNIISGDKDARLQSLFPGNAIGTLTRGIFVAVDNSFQERRQKMNNPTHQEIRQRFDICFQAARMLRGDLKWGVQRIVDILPEVLKYELNGSKWSPSVAERTMWVPSDGT